MIRYAHAALGGLLACAAGLAASLAASGAVGVASAAAPATNWTATCTARDEPTVWWVLAADAPPKVLPDYACTGLYFESVECPNAMGFGRIRSTGEYYGGKLQYELRYLPYGDSSIILRLLDYGEGGVVFVPKPPLPRPGEAVAPASSEPLRLERTELMLRYLSQRERSSAVTTGITLHVWTCPDDTFTIPEAEAAAQGMTVRRHEGRFVLR